MYSIVRKFASQMTDSYEATTVLCDMKKTLKLNTVLLENPIPSDQEGGLRPEIFVILVENSSRLGSMLCRSVYSPYNANYPWRILLICLYSLSVFSVHA
jgi:hypothetical protein